MTGVSTRLAAIDTAISAVSSQIEKLSEFDSTASDAPEVLSFDVGGGTTTFVGPDRVANALAKLTDALDKLFSRRDRMARARGTGIRKTGVARC